MERMRPASLLVFAAFAMGLAPATAGATPRPTAAQPRAAGAPSATVAAPAPAPRAAAGMTVTIEPEGGGTFGAQPTARLAALERAGLLRTTAGLTAVRLANGAMMLDLRGRFREFSVVRIDASGAARLGCVHGARALQGALDPAAPPPAPRFEER